MRNQTIFLFIASVLLMIPGAFLFLDGSHFFRSMECETCSVGIVEAYSSALVLAGVFLGAASVASEVFGTDFSFLNPADRKGLLLWLVAIGALFLVETVFSMEVATDDPYSHFLNARQSWSTPALFFEFFHKPVYNFLGALAAPFGFMAFRLVFAATTFISVVFAYLSAKKLGMKNAWAAAILAGFSPLLFRSAGSGLSESLFAMITIAGVYFLLEKKYLLSAFAVSLLPFNRTEGVLILALWACILLWKKEYKAFLALFAVPAAIWLAGWALNGDMLWVLHQNQNIPGAITYKQDKYPLGNAQYYFAKFFFIVGSAGALLFQLGALKKILGWNSTRGKGFFGTVKSFMEWSYLPLLGSFSLYFMLHVIANSFLKVGDWGFEIYLAAVAPVAAVIAAAGIEPFIEPAKELGRIPAIAAAFAFIAEACLLTVVPADALSRLFTMMFWGVAVVFALSVAKEALGRTKNESTRGGGAAWRTAITCVVVLVSVAGALAYAHPPAKLNYEHETSVEIVQWLNANGYSGRPLLSTMGFLIIESDNTPFGGMDCSFQKSFFASHPEQRPSTDCIYSSFQRYPIAQKGTILVWDPHYSWQFAKTPEVIEKAGYSKQASFDVKGTAEKFVVLEKQ